MRARPDLAQRIQMQCQPAARPFGARDEIRKGALEASSLHHLPRRVYSRGISLTYERERKRKPLWRQRDNISELGGEREREREGDRGGEKLALSLVEEKIRRPYLPKERPREPPVYTETGFVSAASAIKRDGEGENGVRDREKEARNATAFTTSAFTCYVKFRWDPAIHDTTPQRLSFSLARCSPLGPFASQ